MTSRIPFDNQRGRERAHEERDPHRCEALGPAARRRQRGGAEGSHCAILQVPLDVRLGRGERLPLANCGHLRNSGMGREPGGAVMGAEARLPVG